MAEWFILRGILRLGTRTEDVDCEDQDTFHDRHSG